MSDDLTVERSYAVYTYLRMTVHLAMGNVDDPVPPIRRRRSVLVRLADASQRRCAGAFRADGVGDEECAGSRAG